MYQEACPPCQYVCWLAIQGTCDPRRDLVNDLGHEHSGKKPSKPRAVAQACIGMFLHIAAMCGHLELELQSTMHHAMPQASPW